RFLRYHPHHPSNALSLHAALPTFTLTDCGNLGVCPQGQQAAIDGRITKITVDEAIDVNQGGDGHTTKFDVVILDATHFQLRSERDRKSTRLNSSHRTISYAVFCLK